MHITKVELLSSDLPAQKDFYTNILDLPAQLTSSGLEVTVGTTKLHLRAGSGQFRWRLSFCLQHSRESI